MLNDYVPANTRENVEGRLPALVEDVGARQVDEYCSFNTVFGAQRLLRATKQEGI